jgi:peptide deformylase
MEPKQDWLLKDTNPSLRQVAMELTFPITDHDQNLIDRMVSYIDACYQKQDQKYNIRSGIALAAPQVGLLKKVIYIHFDINKKEEKYLIANPKIIAESMMYAYITDGEGCLSVETEHKGVVQRRDRIVVDAFDLISQKPIHIDAQGILAICLQHEIDHLNGILFYDRINHNQPFTANPE